MWIGRRQKDEAIEQKQARVAAGGGERPLYIAADARNLRELERACQEIKERYGRINGVIHSAIVLSDKSLANMTDEQFRAALSAKVDVSVRLAQVFEREPLDFVLYFSSVQSFLKAPGQSNYAAGCTFADAFAEWQSANVAYPVKVMCWGYWGSVGIVSGAEYQQRMAQLGVGSLAPAEGMTGLERLLRAPLQQVVMIRTQRVEAAQAIGVITEEGLSPARIEAPSVCARLAGVASAAMRDESVRVPMRTWEQQRHEMDALLVKMLWARMTNMARNGEPGAWTEEEWAKSTGVAGEYRRWLAESLRILAGHGYLAEENGKWKVAQRRRAEEEADLWRDWGEKDERVG